MLKHCTFAVLGIVLAEIASLTSARAECSQGTRQTLNAAMDAYKHWQAYGAAATPTDKGLAAPEWAVFERDMDWIVDNGNVTRCSRTTQLLYYAFSASRDAMRMTRLYALRQAGIADVPDGVLGNVVGTALAVYYDDVRTLYYLGYARKRPTEYTHFKRDVSGWFVTTGGTFASWENTPAPRSKPAPRTCARRDSVPTIVDQVQPEFPEPAKDVGLGKTTIGVTVTIGPSGNLIDARVTDTSFNPAIDNAALGGAFLSTYAPGMRDCQPAMGTLLVNLIDQPD